MLYLQLLSEMNFSHYSELPSRFTIDITFFQLFLYVHTNTTLCESALLLKQ